MSFTTRVVDILKKRKDIVNLEVDADTKLIYFDGGPKLFDSDCIFDSCSSDFSTKLLECFLRHEVDMGWNISIELSKLLSKQGHLVAEIAEPIVTRPPELGFSDNFLFLSYFGNSINWEPYCVSLLDWVPEDSRDGLFLACFRLNSFNIYKKLVKRFHEWIDSQDWGEGSGELYALSIFLKKWDQTPNFNLHESLKTAR
ncbi:MAG: hypothetical protein ACOX52_06290 [Verrucomicrobiota bacterium]|jgi:hypothetical protein